MCEGRPIGRPSSFRDLSASVLLLLVAARVRVRGRGRGRGRGRRRLVVPVPVPVAGPGGVALLPRWVRAVAAVLVLRRLTRVLAARAGHTVGLVRAASRLVVLHL